MYSSSNLQRIFDFFIEDTGMETIAAGMETNAAGMESNATGMNDNVASVDGKDETFPEHQI